MKKAFTLLEIVVVVAILGLIMTMLSGSLGMSFKLKNLTETNERLTSKANFILGELKKNILEARAETIVCSSSRTQLEYITLGGATVILSCDIGSTRIASQSGEVVFNLSDKDVIPRTCNSFVNCRLNTDTSMVESVGITLDLVTTVGHEGVGSSGRFYQTLSPRLW
ncbi:MAG TPA: type II secretion system protein [Candidatus Woesebacteria bacterium]|jgi:prepilin-type N-terminal cleavage/methylation domain-containing protein|nr:type II secretion system protein [Candidatus Woesebacteria bacterium]